MKDYGSGVSTEKKEILFAKTLEQVKNTAKEQGNCISAQQVEEAFGPLALSGEQMDMVYAYLHQRKIGVGEPVDPDEYLAPEEKDYLEHYLETLRALPQVSAGEREAITLSAMAGDGDARSRLTELFRRWRRLRSSMQGRASSWRI